MGNIASVFRGLTGINKEIGIVMVGLESAGKTTILHKLKLGEIVTTSSPTNNGFNAQTVQYKNIGFAVWDVRGGQDLWRQYFTNAQGMPQDLLLIR